MLDNNFFKNENRTRVLFYGRREFIFPVDLGELRYLWNLVSSVQSLVNIVIKEVFWVVDASVLRRMWMLVNSVICGRQCPQLCVDLSDPCVEPGDHSYLWALVSSVIQSTES